MRNLKRKDLVNLFNTDEWVSEFEKQIDNKIEGWVILWNGEMIKPIGGNSYYFASEKSALQALERNISFYTAVKNDLCQKLNGFIYYDYSMHKDTEEWNKYYMQKEYSAHHSLDYREREKIEEKNSLEFQIMQSRRNEWCLIETFSNNIVKSVLIPAWIKEGKLEIKQV